MENQCREPMGKTMGKPMGNQGNNPGEITKGKTKGKQRKTKGKQGNTLGEHNGNYQMGAVCHGKTLEKMANPWENQREHPR